MGELIAGQYAVFGITGKGVFSSVVRAREASCPEHVLAIKILRNNAVM